MADVVEMDTDDSAIAVNTYQTAMRALSLEHSHLAFTMSSHIPYKCLKELQTNVYC